MTLDSDRYTRRDILWIFALTFVLFPSSPVGNPSSSAGSGGDAATGLIRVAQKYGAEFGGKNVRQIFPSRKGG